VPTVRDNAKESCPTFTGHAKRLQRAFEDPAAFQGTEEERLIMFRRVRDEIRDYMKTFPC
jgi:arsenate reductase